METHYREGSVQDIAGLPVDPGTMFSDYANTYKKRVEKRQTRLTRQVTFIKPFLEPDEKLLFVTTGLSPTTFLEHYTMGFMVYSLKQALFICTDRRFFHVPTGGNRKYRNSISHVFWTDCQNITNRMRGLEIEYAGGKKDLFRYIPSRDKRKIVSIFEAKTAPAVQRGTSKGRVHLCPRCGGEMAEDIYSCPECRLEFKNRASGRKISIIYPGGGYFYTNHPIMGLGDAATEIFLTVLVVMALIDVFGGRSGELVILLFTGVFLAIEKVISVYHSDHFIKEYIPVERDIKPFAGSR